MQKPELCVSDPLLSTWLEVLISANKTSGDSSLSKTKPAALLYTYKVLLTHNMMWKVGKYKFGFSLFIIY